MRLFVAYQWERGRRGQGTCVTVWVLRSKALTPPRPAVSTTSRPLWSSGEKRVVGGGTRRGPRAWLTFPESPGGRASGGKKKAASWDDAAHQLPPCPGVPANLVVWEGMSSRVGEEPDADPERGWLFLRPRRPKERLLVGMRQLTTFPAPLPRRPSRCGLLGGMGQNVSRASSGLS